MSTRPLALRIATAARRARSLPSGGHGPSALLTRAAALLEVAEAAARHHYPDVADTALCRLERLCGGTEVRS